MAFASTWPSVKVCNGSPANGVPASTVAQLDGGSSGIVASEIDESRLWVAVKPIEPTGIDPTGIEPTGIDPTGIDPTGIEPTGAELAVPAASKKSDGGTLLSLTVAAPASTDGFVEAMLTVPSGATLGSKAVEHTENSDVLPLAFVAVAVTASPLVTPEAAGLVNVAVNDEFPAVTAAESVPRYVAPSPWLLLSHAGLAKNSTV